MQHGRTSFHCDSCQSSFTAPRVEWMATAYDAPQPCPHCGSLHTYPYQWLDHLGIHRPPTTYKQIWEMQDRLKAAAGETQDEEK